jgi:hypothetical protein
LEAVSHQITESSIFYYRPRRAALLRADGHCIGSRWKPLQVEPLAPRRRPTDVAPLDKPPLRVIEQQQKISGLRCFYLHCHPLGSRIGKGFYVGFQRLPEEKAR